MSSEQNNHYAVYIWGLDTGEWNRVHFFNDAGEYVLLDIPSAVNASRRAMAAFITPEDMEQVNSEPEIEKSEDAIKFLDNRSNLYYSYATRQRRVVRALDQRKNMKHLELRDPAPYVPPTPRSKIERELESLE